MEWMKHFGAAFAALLLISAIASPAASCSDTTPCTVDEGNYFLDAPDSVVGKPPAIVFIHGWGGTGQGAMRNRGMVDAFLDRGYVVAAPSGLPRVNGKGGTWAFRPETRGPRDELTFITSVRDDLIATHNVDPDRIVLAGFSIGGSMTSYFACQMPDGFAAYAPIGGNFWRPHPARCAGPVRMLHTHGWSDGTVPLEGRILRGADARDADALIQGDIFHALSIWRDTNRCFQLKADRFVTDGYFMRRAWDRCAEGAALEFALFPGGHIIPRQWPGLVADWFEGL
ncbi:MAG: prolyl oligopeptidase family serine peptidase [Marinovum sp.]|nr:prolyl oligopeptidase family serine peptidase [Marinovum sp.]